MTFLHNLIQNLKIRALLEDAEINNRVTLILKGCDLQTLPEHLFLCRDLHYLFLHHNKLTTIDPRIAELFALSKLTLDFNRLILLPKELGELSGLEELNLNHNPLRNLFPEIGNLKSLEILWCNYIEIDDLPEEFSKLSLLDTLGLRGNRLTKVPECLLNLKLLRWLTLENNCIKEIPEDIDRLESMVHLNLKRNKIESVPFAIIRCKKLQFLFLCFNQIKTLPSGDNKWDLSEMKSLVYIDIRNNPIMDEPNIEEYIKDYKQLRTEENWPSIDADSSITTLQEADNAVPPDDIPAEQPQDGLNRDSAESDMSISADEDWECSIASSELNYTDNSAYDEDMADGQMIELILPEISRFATNSS